MSEEEDKKKSLNSTAGVRGLLNMEDSDQESANTSQAAGAPPADLPIGLPPEIEEPLRTQQTKPEILEEVQTPLGGPAPALETSPLEQLTAPAQRQGHELYGMFLRFFRSAGIYILIFLIGLGLYFFYFSDFSFNNLLNKDRLKIETLNSSSQNKELEALKKDQQDDYVAWMKQFFFDVNDEAIISMDTDVSGNGLNNFEKYLLNLNPKVYSTRGGIGDGEAVLQDINPWTGKAFTDEQKELVEKYINKELVSNRITAAALSRGITRFAPYVSADSPYYIEPSVLAEGGNSTPETLSNQQAYQALTSSQNPTLNPSSQIDQAVPGRLDVPANKISVPLIWTQDVKNFDADLKKGIVHYPGTPFPGETGTSYISGHSSGYIWDHSPYKQVFAVLGQVKDGTSFTITVQQKDGKQVVYHYVVDHRGEYAANDQAQFVSTGTSMVALSTCWPVGTTDRRLVLFAKLTQTERP